MSARHRHPLHLSTLIGLLSLTLGAYAFVFVTVLIGAAP